MRHRPAQQSQGGNKRTHWACESRPAIPAFLDVAVSAKDAELQGVTIIAVSAFDDPQIGIRLPKHFDNYSDAVRPAFFMPDGLLNGLTEKQLRDFFACLRISQPISN